MQDAAALHRLANLRSLSQLHFSSEKLEHARVPTPGKGTPEHGALHSQHDPQVS